MGTVPSKTCSSCRFWDARPTRKYKQRHVCFLVNLPRPGCMTGCAAWQEILANQTRRQAREG